MNMQQRLQELCRKNHIRFEVDYTDKKYEGKDRKAYRGYRDPYVLVLGNNEAENHTVSINIRGNKQMKDVPLDKFIEICNGMNEEHSLELVDSAE